MKLFKYNNTWSEHIIACETKEEAVLKIKKTLSKKDFENWDDEFDIPEVKELELNKVITVYTT